MLKSWVKYQSYKGFTAHKHTAVWWVCMMIENYRLEAVRWKQSGNTVRHFQPSHTSWWPHRELHGEVQLRYSKAQRAGDRLLFCFFSHARSCVVRHRSFFWRRARSRWCCCAPPSSTTRRRRRSTFWTESSTTRTASTEQVPHSYVHTSPL